MALIIKIFRQILKQRKWKDYKLCSRRVCYRCGKSGHFIAKCPYTSDRDRDDDKKGKKKMEKKRYYNKKMGGEAHKGREWDSDESSTDSSSNEDAANIAVKKGLLFPNVGHKCLMAKDGKKKKVYSRDTPKYTTSNDVGSSSDDNDDLTSLFANLTKDQKKKINELIETISEKDDILESQENLLVKENKKFVMLKNAYALEVKNVKTLSKKCLCNDSISCLRTENASLITKIEELNACNVSTSTVEHVTICTRYRDVNIDAMDDHLALIKEQNDHIAKLNAKIAKHELENEIFKFARNMLYNGRRPSIKYGIGFQQGSQSNIKLNAPKNRLSNFVKGKAPMIQDREGYILYPENYLEHKIRRIYARKSHIVSHHAYMYSNEASSSRHSTHIKMPKKKTVDASNEHSISFKTFDASFLLTNKSGKVVSNMLGQTQES
jgi:hypothetical protein